MSVAVSYGYGWMLSFVTPIFTFMFLAMPKWIGWSMATQLLIRLALCLSFGMIIAEFFLSYPLLCIPVYALLFFVIYYNDATAPPMATFFMTLAITLIPIMSFSGIAVSHILAIYLLFNMFAGLFFACFFHGLLPNSLAALPPETKKKSAAKPPAPAKKERIRLALVSTIVALSAVVIFFSLNLSQYALAMIYICIMAGTPNLNASVQTMKANALATCIGGVAIIIVFNLLVAVPNYLFLTAVTFLFCLLFSVKIYGGSQRAAAFSSGLSTFLVLLGTSTGVDKTADTNFYLRIAQVLFAGIFTLAGLYIVEHLSRPRQGFLASILLRFRRLSKS